MGSGAVSAAERLSSLPGLPSAAPAKEASSQNAMHPAPVLLLLDTPWSFLQG